MKANVEVFERIASDIGVVRYRGEEVTSFCRRAAYSAARFVIDAYCMDDGVDAARGISKQGINRRLKGWVAQLDSFCPGLGSWFDAEEKGIAVVYNRLIDMGEIRPNGFGGTFLATPPHLLPVGKDTALLLGFYDSSSKSSSICGIGRRELVTSGLATIATVNSDIHPVIESWWNDEVELRSWEKAENFGDLRFANPKTSRWSLRKSDVWVDDPYWMEDLSLAKIEGEDKGQPLLVVRKKKGRIMASRIGWCQAQSLFFCMRDYAGNKATARYTVLDKEHVSLAAPIGFIPGRVNRVLDAVTWPVGDVVDRLSRIARIEVLSLIKELLLACHIGLEEDR